MSKKQQEKQRERNHELELQKNPIHLFTCSCGKVDGLNFKDFRQHLTNEHGLTADQLKGKKQMRMHIDGDYWYSSQYDWTLDSGLTFSEYFEAARKKDDPMRFV